MKFFFKKAIAYVLKIESKLVLAKYQPKIIAITGSIGKTSTKDAVYAVLSKVSYVRKSEKSYNSEIGLPLTILGIPNGWNNPVTWLKNIWQGLRLVLSTRKYPKWLILEVGVGKQGDMRRTALWLKTDVVIITAIGFTPAHIEFFSSRKRLIEEKSELAKTLKQDGFLILNADDEDVKGMKERTKSLAITYGFKEGADILGSGESIFYNQAGEPAGVIFRVDEGGSSLPVKIEGVFGRNHVYAALAALAAASTLKFNILNATGALKNYDAPPGRMRLLRGICGSLIIDDTYNSSPAAAESALKTFGGIKAQGRKIAVLGDMLELGRHTEKAHRDIGRIAKENCHILVTVGPRAEAVKEGAIEAGMNGADIFEFLDSSKAGEFMQTFAQEKDLILVKGSQGMRLERVVEKILLDQENKEKLLVRQDKEWREKE